MTTISISGAIPAFFRLVERVVDKLLDDDQQPVLHRLAGLLDQFGDGGEIGETR